MCPHHQQSCRLQRPENSGWGWASSGERCYIWQTYTLHHEQWFTWWWMIGELQVMNLYSVSWEVIHMTSRTIRGLVPNLSGDNRGISSSPPFSFLPPPWGSAHQKHGHLSVWSWTRSYPNSVYVHVHFFFLGVYVLFPLKMYTPQRWREMRSSSTPSHPWGVIHQDWIWPWRMAVVLWCTRSHWMGPRLHSCPLGASGVLGLIRHGVRLAGERLGGPCSSVLLSLTGIGLRDCLWVPRPLWQFVFLHWSFSKVIYWSFQTMTATFLFLKSNLK